MPRLEDLTDEHEHCGWAHPLDLQVVATTSSGFEQVIEIREDDCGNRLLLMGGFLQCKGLKDAKQEVSCFAGVRFK